MNTNIKTYETTNNHTNVKDETSRTALGIGIAMAALIGLWGVACLIGGIASSGIGGIVVGYIKAVTG